MTLKLEIEGGLARLTLNRPDKSNAMTPEMVDALFAACRDIEQSTARVAILSSKGKIFCAGGDIEAWSTQTPEQFGRHWIRDGHRAFDALARLRQPVIAVLDGHTLGGGLELAACADLRIAEEHIKIGQPETGLGIIPGWSGTQRVSRRFGSQAARRMALFGEVFSANDALRLGLVDHVVETGAAQAFALDIARAVLDRAPRATELTKMMINAAEGEERERIIDALAGTIAAASDDLTEGLSAFHAKRRPNYGEEDT